MVCGSAAPIKGTPRPCPPCSVSCPTQTDLFLCIVFSRPSRKAAKILRVLTITHYFPSHGGGIERVAERLVLEFAQWGLTIRWLSSNIDPPPAQLPPGVTCVPI